MTLEPEAGLPTIRRWETPRRYCVGVVQKNLFDQWELLRVWGGRGTRLGNHSVQVANSRQEALQLLEYECKRRQQHGYVQVAATEIRSESAA